GWVLFGFVIVGLFMLGARWADPDTVPAVPRDGEPARSQRAAVLPLAIVLTLLLLAATAQRFQADLGSSWKFLLPVGALLLYVLFKRFGRQPAGEAAEAGVVRPAITRESYVSSRSAAVV